MRVVLFFDLPTTEEDEKREYRIFRKFLISEGFMMMQQSVYSKLALNASVVESIKLNLKKHKPKYGLVQIMTLTEKQFSSMEFLVGERNSDVIDTIERLVEI